MRERKERLSRTQLKGREREAGAQTVITRAPLKVPKNDRRRTAQGKLAIGREDDRFRDPRSALPLRPAGSRTSMYQAYGTSPNLLVPFHVSITAPVPPVYVKD